LLRLNQTDDLARLRVAAQSLFGENAPSVHFDLERAPRGLDQLDLGGGEFLANLGRQTGGPGLIVSDDAEFDRDAHGERIAALDMPRHTADLARIQSDRNRRQACQRSPA
jgi:hypothetical protein